MKNLFQILIIAICILFGQTAEQIEQAKEIIQRTGMSESQAREAAKARGYTDKQIDAAIQKEKALKSNVKESVPESVERIDLPELGESNNIRQEKPVFKIIKPTVDQELPLLETNKIIVGEELPVIGQNELKIVENTFFHLIFLS